MPALTVLLSPTHSMDTGVRLGTRLGYKEPGVTGESLHKQNSSDGVYTHDCLTTHLVLRYV